MLLASAFVIGHNKSGSGDGRTKVGFCAGVEAVARLVNPSSLLNGAIWWSAHGHWMASIDPWHVCRLYICQDTKPMRVCVRVSVEQCLRKKAFCYFGVCWRWFCQQLLTLPLLWQHAWLVSTLKALTFSISCCYFSPSGRTQHIWTPLSILWKLHLSF